MRIYKTPGNRNRAYVIDKKGNKLFYGSIYQCNKFKKYMMEGEAENEKGDHRTQSQGTAGR